MVGKSGDGSLAGALGDCCREGDSSDLECSAGVADRGELTARSVERDGGCEEANVATDPMMQRPIWETLLDSAQRQELSPGHEGVPARASTAA